MEGEREEERGKKGRNSICQGPGERDTWILKMWLRIKYKYSSARQKKIQTQSAQWCCWNNWVNQLLAIYQLSSLCRENSKESRWKAISFSINFRQRTALLQDCFLATLTQHFPNTIPLISHVLYFSERMCVGQLCTLWSHLLLSGLFQVFYYAQGIQSPAL